MLEPRGHGQARRGGVGECSAEDMAQHDCAAAQEVMRGVLGHDSKAFWVGHSAGGCFVAMALACGWLKEANMAGVILMGTEMTVGYGYLRNPCMAPVIKLLFRLMGGVRADLFGWGPEPESNAYMDDFMRWLQRGWVSRAGQSVNEGLAALRSVPVLAISSAGDTVNPATGCKALFDHIHSPDKQFQLFSKENGHSSDFTHVGMVISKQAAIDIHPYISAWLQSHL